MDWIGFNRIFINETPLKPCHFDQWLAQREQCSKRAIPMEGKKIAEFDFSYRR